MDYNSNSFNTILLMFFPLLSTVISNLQPHPFFSSTACSCSNGLLCFVSLLVVEIAEGLFWCHLRSHSSGLLCLTNLASLHHRKCRVLHCSFLSLSSLDVSLFVVIACMLISKPLIEAIIVKMCFYANTC